jgi:hypothetical protein
VSKLTFEVDQKTCVYLVDLNCKPKAFKKKKKKKKKKNGQFKFFGWKKIRLFPKVLISLGLGRRVFSAKSLAQDSPMFSQKEISAETFFTPENRYFGPTYILSPRENIPSPRYPPRGDSRRDFFYA